MNTRRRGRYSTLYRYLAAETSFSFFVSFLFFFFIFFINQLLLMAEEILSKRAPPGQVALLILFSIPAIIAMSAPFASLVGILMSVGRLSSDNEILVMRASGVPYRKILAPIAVFGVVVSMLSFAANDVLLPAGTLEFGKLYRKLLLSTPAIELESNTAKKFNDTIIITGPMEKNAIKDILIIDRTAAGEKRIILSSRAGIDKGDGTAIQLHLEDSFIQTVKDNNNEDFDYALADRLSYAIAQKNIISSFGSVGPREMSSLDLNREIQKKDKELESKLELKRNKIFSSAANLQAFYLSGPDSPNWNKRKNEAAKIGQLKDEMKDAEADRTLQVYRLEYYKKFSIPFGALAFVFLAFPLGLYARKSGQSVGFGIGLLLAVLYWALLIGGQTLGVRMNYSPFLAMWLPNFIVLAAGVVLLAARRAS